MAQHVIIFSPHSSFDGVDHLINIFSNCLLRRIASFQVSNSFRSVSLLAVSPSRRLAFVEAPCAGILPVLSVFLEANETSESIPYSEKKRTNGDLNCRSLEWQSSMLTARPRHSPQDKDYVGGATCWFSNINTSSLHVSQSPSRTFWTYF